MRCCFDNPSMGAHLLPLPIMAAAPPPPSPFLNPKFPVPKRRRYKNSPPTAAPRWDSNAETVRSRRFRFNDFLSDDNDDDDEDYEFNFGRKGEQRTWWSDDGEFEFWEESVDGFEVVYKVQINIIYLFFPWIYLVLLSTHWVKLSKSSLEIQLLERGCPSGYYVNY